MNLPNCAHDCAVESGVQFDEAAFNKEAETLTTAEVRKRWPRRQCPKCGTIVYASFAHFIAGDW